MQTTTDRKPHLDLLRIISIFAVLFIHSNTHGSTLFLHAENRIEYLLSLFLTVFVRFAVPVFFMISGALLLGRNEPLRKVMQRALRIAAVSLLTFAMYYVLIGLHMHTLVLQPAAIWDFLCSIWKSPLVVSLWYLYAYLAAMFMLPFLRPLAQGLSTHGFAYLLVLHIILSAIVPVVGKLVFHAPLASNFSIPFATNHCIVFMLFGYAAEHRVPESFFTRKHTAVLFAVAFAMGTLCCVLTWMLCRRDGNTVESATTFMNCFAVFPSAALYCGARTLFRYRTLSPRAYRLLKAAAQNVFGIYLIEKILRESLEGICTHLTPHIFELPACIVWLLGCFSCGQIAIWLVRRIPLVRKLIG